MGMQTLNLDDIKDDDDDTVEISTPADNEVDLPDDDDIEIVDDTPERDRGRKPLDKPVAEPTDDELNAYTDGVKKRIKELTHARHDERRAKEALQREKAELDRLAQALMAENNRLKSYVTDGEKQYVETAKSAATLELEAAKKRYKEAYDSGDSDAVLAAQEALTDAKFKMAKVEAFRPTALQPEQNVVQPQQAPQPKPEIDDRTVKWQAKNQWFGAPGYEEMTSFSLGLHQKLVNSGVDPRTDSYFEQIDARLRKTFPEFFGTSNAGTADTPKPRSVVAPTTRTTSVRKVQLTAQQVAIAKRFGLTPRQYAEELAKLEKNNG